MVKEMTERRQVDWPPSKLPRLSGADANDGAVTVAAPAPATAPLVLGLGLGVGGTRSDSSGSDAEASATRVVTTRPSALTFMQRQELEQQVLIYRYFVANAPVPVNLVLPIWNSVTASSPAPQPQRFPSLAGLGRLRFDHSSSMEPEPDRCRRTDGKKWRCSRGVVPGNKYCERHVNRGRGRSRKPVEAATSAVPIRAIHAADAQATSNAHAPPQPQHLRFASPAGVFVAHGTARAT